MSASRLRETLQGCLGGSVSWRSRSRSLNVYPVAFRIASSALMKRVTARYVELDVVASSSDTLPFDFEV